MKDMPFGKHKGTPVADVPTDYLEWLASKDDFKDPLKSVVDAELERVIAEPFERNASLAIDYVIAELEKETCTLELSTR